MHAAILSRRSSLCFVALMICPAGAPASLLTTGSMESGESEYWLFFLSFFERASAQALTRRWSLSTFVHWFNQSINQSVNQFDQSEWSWSGLRLGSCLFLTFLIFLCFTVGLHKCFCSCLSQYTLVKQVGLV